MVPVWVKKVSSCRRSSGCGKTARHRKFLQKDRREETFKKDDEQSKTGHAVGDPSQSVHRHVSCNDELWKSHSGMGHVTQ